VRVAAGALASVSHGLLVKVASDRQAGGAATEEGAMLGRDQSGAALGRSEVHVVSGTVAGASAAGKAPRPWNSTPVRQLPHRPACSSENER
jgi:hypothetical protein